MIIVDGKNIANEILIDLKKENKPAKFLGAVLVGDDKSSESFLKQKERIAKGLGIDFRIYKFPLKISKDDLRKEVLKISSHKTCGGVIVQLPLPPDIDRHYVLNAIPREKDVDVLTERALGAFYTERNPVLPPSVGVLKKIIGIYNLKLADLNVAVVGLGFLVGKPIATWLTRKTKELWLLHRGSDLKKLKEADLVILGTGSPGLIKPEMLKPGVNIVDFGYGELTNGKIQGDFNSDLIKDDKNFSGFYTPTPNGTGPILVAQILENFYKLNS